MDEKRKKLIIEAVAPMAAIGSMPTNLPTTKVSTAVYICWNAVDRSMGRVNRTRTLAGDPWVRSVSSKRVFMDRHSLRVGPGGLRPGGPT